MSRIRVVHLPARTPYVRKIQSADIAMLNGSTTEHGTIPTTVTAEWIPQRRPLDWLDVVHLHHIEFESTSVLEQLLSACEDASVNVVFTAHDVIPMFIPSSDFYERLRVVARSSATWIGLTKSSIATLQKNIPHLPDIHFIPHGYVISPDELEYRVRAPIDGASRYLMHGSLRPNRDHLATVANWSLATIDDNAALDLLLRPFSPADFDRHDINALMSTIRADERIRLRMKAHASDSDIMEAGLQADALLLPYLYGTHSGQLEFAFDLNLLPVCASVGSLRDQYAVHSDLVDEPIWFDWSGHQPFLYGERFVTALEAAHERLAPSTRRNPNREFLAYRRQEHAGFLDAHQEIYGDCAD